MSRPQIDVTEVLLDPVVAGETFTVIRREETVNKFGESVLRQIVIPNVIGSVTPTSPFSLTREAAYESQNKTIQVITKFMLRGASLDLDGKSYQPDYVIWKGDSFIVQSIDDFSQYGAGMIGAECTSVTFTGDPPYVTPASYSGRLDFTRPRNSMFPGGVWRCR